MQTFKERNPLLVKILVVVLLALLCCNLPFLSLCLKEDLFRPPNTKVLFSACNKHLVVTGVPGGEVLFVSRGNADNEYLVDNAYLLDLQTGKKRDVSNDPLLLDHGIFLNSELVWLEGTPGGTSHPSYRPHYILDLTNGKRYELTDLSDWIDQPAPPDYTPHFQSAEQVFIHHGYNRAIALPPNFRQNPEEGVILYKSQLNTETDFENGKLLDIIMKNLGVDYDIVDFSLRYTDVLSPTGKYVVRNDGIYLSGTNTPIVNLGSRYYFRGWYYDESGVVFREIGYDLIHIGAWSSFYYIPSPVLKSRLPAP